MKKMEHKAELKGGEWSDIQHDYGIRDETQNGGIKYFRSDEVNKKQKMVLDEKTLFLLKISNLK
jgi:predicted transcriptional regulator with HTH domain